MDFSISTSLEDPLTFRPHALSPAHSPQIFLSQVAYGFAATSVNYTLVEEIII